MRVLFINYEFPPIGGGGGTTTKYLAKAMVAKGHNIRVITASYGNLPLFEKIDGYEILRIRCKRRLESQCTQREMFSFVFHAIKPVLEQVEKWQPDVVQVFFALPTGPLGLISKKFKKVPYVIYLLGADVPGFLANEMDWEHKILKGISSLIWKNASAVVANSQGLAELGQKAFPDIEIKVISNGINLSDFKPSGDNQIFGNLLFVGRLVPQKSVLTALAALDVLVNQLGNKKIKLRIVGEGVEREKAERFISEKKLNDNVEFLGWVKLERLACLYQTSDIFILSSTFEGMPSVVLQSLACGLPVVSTRVYGSEDIVVDGENGYLVDIGDSGTMAKKINGLLKDEKRLFEMKKLSSSTILRFDWSNIATDFQNLYKEIIENNDRDK